MSVHSEDARTTAALGMPSLRRPLGAADLPGLFVAAFLVYQCALPAVAVGPYPDFWHFQFDSTRVSWETLGRHEMARYQITKHPLHVILTTPLYRLAAPVHRRLWSPTTAANMTLTFPVATLGALNVVVACLVFAQIGFPRGAALVLAAMFGLSASAFLVSSFPDTYVTTALMTNLVVLLWLRDPHLRRWPRLAAATVAAGLCAPQQMLVVLMPMAGLLAVNRSWPALVAAARYAATSGAAHAVLFLLPMLYLTRGDAGGFVSHEVGRWSALAHLVSLDAWATIAATHGVNAVALLVPPHAVVSFRTMVAYPAFAATATVIGLYVVGARVRRGRCEVLPLAVRTGLALYVAVYAMFFVWWMPTQPMLFTAPVALPLWLLVMANWVPDSHRRGWFAAHLVLVVALAGCVAVLLTRVATPDPEHHRVGAAPEATVVVGAAGASGTAPRA